MPTCTGQPGCRPSSHWHLRRPLTLHGTAAAGFSVVGGVLRGLRRDPPDGDKALRSEADRSRRARRVCRRWRAVSRAAHDAAPAGRRRRRGIRARGARRLCRARGSRARARRARRSGFCVRGFCSRSTAAARRSRHSAQWSLRRGCARRSRGADLRLLGVDFSGNPNRAGFADFAPAFAAARKHELRVAARRRGRRALLSLPSAPSASATHCYSATSRHRRSRPRPSRSSSARRRTA